MNFALIAGLIISQVFCADTLTESLAKLNRVERKYAEICLERTKTAGHRQLLVTALKNDFDENDGYYRIALNYDSAHFIRCDFKLKGGKLIKAEEISDGQIQRSY